MSLSYFHGFDNSRSKKGFLFTQPNIQFFLCHFSMKYRWKCEKLTNIPGKQCRVSLNNLYEKYSCAYTNNRNLITPKAREWDKQKIIFFQKKNI